MKNSRIVLIVIIILVFNPVTLILGWLGMMRWENANPEKGENLARVEWLPETASDISFYRSYSWKSWEFSMAERDFRREWASRYNLKEITEKQVISRFSWWDFRIEKPPHDSLTFFREEKNHLAEVVHGLYASERWDNGGGYHIAFDRDEDRVYFQSNPR